MKVLKVINREQRGVVSIVVTMIIMIVLTLVVTGFAQLARREQREVLDRQLATQAQYAAESGINDAQSRVRQEMAAENYNNADDCGDYGDLSGLGTANAVPTCILVDKKPKKILLSNIQTNKSKVIPIEQGQGTLDRLMISWQNQATGNPNNVRCSDVNTCQFMPSAGANSWGNDNVGILRVDLVPTKNEDARPLDPNNLRNKMFTAFLVPTNSGGQVLYSQAAGVSNQGLKVAGNCSGASVEKKCSVMISRLNDPAARSQYYLRVKALYNVSDVVICPGSAGGALTCDPSENLVGAQAVIDVTAKAADVLKRLQVRIAVDPEALGTQAIPEYAIESATDVCKLISVTPTPSQAISGC